MNPTHIDPFAPADSPQHPANWAPPFREATVQHPGSGVPVSTTDPRAAQVAHLMDPAADADGVSEEEMADR